MEGSVVAKPTDTATCTEVCACSKQAISRIISIIDDSTGYRTAYSITSHIDDTSTRKTALSAKMSKAEGDGIGSSSRIGGIRSRNRVRYAHTHPPIHSSGSEPIRYRKSRDHGQRHIPRAWG